MLRNAFLRDPTEVKIPAKDAGSDAAGPKRRALEMEKSQASLLPVGPRGTQTSAGRRVRGGVKRVRVRGDEKPWLLKDRPKISPVVSCRANDVPDKVMAGDPITSAPTHQIVVAELVHDLATKGAVRVLGPDRHAEATAETNPK